MSGGFVDPRYMTREQYAGLLSSLQQARANGVLDSLSMVNRPKGMLSDAISPMMMAETALGFTPAGIAVDAKDFIKSAMQGDKLGMAMAGVGAIPVVGDVAKAGVKTLSKSEAAENLAKFLEGSVVREPVYHGTNKSFDVFNMDLSRDIGAHFGTKEQAKKFGNVGEYYINAKTNDEAIKDIFSNRNVKFHDMAYELYDNDLIDYNQLNELTKKYDTPYYRDLREKATYLDDREDYEFFEEYQRQTRKFWEDAKKEIEKNGFNGIKYKNSFEGRGDSYVVFSPKQIKSATGNRGTFDPNDPNILHGAAPVGLLGAGAYQANKDKKEKRK